MAAREIRRLRGVSPPWFALGRVTLSAIAAWALLAVLDRNRRPLCADLLALIGVGVFELVLFCLLSHLAVLRAPAGRTSVLANTTTLFVLPLSLVVLRERIPGRRWLAAALGLAGVVALSGPWAIDWSSSSVLAGHAFPLAAALSFSRVLILVRVGDVGSFVTGPGRWSRSVTMTSTSAGSGCCALPR